MESSPEVVALMRRTVELLERIEAKLGTESASPLTAADRAFLTKFFPAVDGHLGSCVWQGAELFERAREDDDLRGALEGMTPQLLGKLLARASDIRLNNWVLGRGKKVRGGRLWCVERI